MVSPHLSPAMDHQQQRVVYGYSEHTYVTSGVAAPYIEAQLPPPPPRRLSPFRILVRVFIAVYVVIGLLALLTWLIYRPQVIHVAVVAATLVRFDLNSTAAAASDPVLAYNITARLAVSNPNRRVSVYYDVLRAEAFYQGQRFCSHALPLSFQDVGSADTVPAVLAGSAAPVRDVDEYRGDRDARVFPVDLFVDGVVRYKYGEMRTSTPSTMTAKCQLALQPMVASGRVDCTMIDF